MVRRLATIFFFIFFVIFFGFFLREGLLGKPPDIGFAPLELHVLQEMLLSGQTQNAKSLAALELESEAVSGANVSGLVKPEELNTEEVPIVLPKSSKAPVVPFPAAVSGVL